MSSKKKVAETLNEVADLLEIKGVQYKPRAYRRAAREIDSLSEDLSELHQSGRLEEIPSVGENIAAKIAEILETGQLQYHRELKDEIPVDPQLLKVRNLGPKKAKKLWKELGITTLEDLDKAGEDGRISEVKGFGSRSEEKILKGLEVVKRSRGKSHLSGVLPVAHEIKGELEKSGLFTELSFAGSLRRRKYQVGDVDILGTTDRVEEGMDFFVSLDPVSEILSKGDTKSSIRTRRGLRVDLRIVEEESFGSAMQYFTGSQEHNVRLRQLAISEGYKLNEYGLYRDDSDGKVAGKTEKGVYQELGLSWIPPELREDGGEIEAAGEKELPNLVDAGAIEGDLHCHSVRSSDGEIPVEVLGEEAQTRGYSYLAVTDHSEAGGIVGGLTDGNVSDHLAEVRGVNRNLEGLKLLAGVEVNIQKDGSLDLTESSLRKLDIVLAGIHSHFDLPAEEMTRRVARAMEDDNVDIIAHPTGRKLGERGSFELDWERIFSRAKETRTALEINASPSRTDLDDKLIRSAVEEGVQLSIGTDSHRTDHLDFMDLGLYLARRGWCEPDDLLNTRSLDELKEWFEG